MSDATAPADPDNGKQTLRELVVDVIMLVLIAANLVFIVFDWTFTYRHFQELLEVTVPAFHDFYATEVHPNFLFYDLIFVAVFVAEILVRWGLAIYRGTYRRWYFYPLVHWYDVLGCIPVGTFRSLRVLRLVVMIRKMQRLGLIDLTQTAIYEAFVYYRDRFVQEITDRVVVRIVSGIQHEVSTNDVVVDRITKEVIGPRRDDLVNALTHRLQAATADAYSSYRPAFQRYVDAVITQAVNNNREISTIGMIPGVGSTIAHLLKEAISDIVYNVLNQIMDDIGSQENNRVIAEITSISADAAFSSNYEQELNTMVRSLLIDALEVVKDQIEVYEWDPRAASEQRHIEERPPFVAEKPASNPS